jgi:hypothetical protein
MRQKRLKFIKGKGLVEGEFQEYPVLILPVIPARLEISPGPPSLK